MSDIKILVGCDPEVFVKEGGKFVSAYGLIQGDKANPQRVERGAVQVDGMALEFNIDPAASEDEFFLNVSTVYNTLRAMCPGFEVVAAPVADFPLEYIRSQPEKARELGCDPDFNAWLNAVNVKPDGELPMRTASGHVHIGWGNGFEPGSPEHIADCNAVTKQMDFFLGLPSVVYDDDVRRRAMYGKAGACRYKSYGVEYRTLSNAWLKSETMMRWVYRSVQNGMQQLLSGIVLAEKYGDIQEIINTSNVKEAKAIIKDAGLEVCNG